MIMSISRRTVWYLISSGLGLVVLTIVAWVVSLVSASLVLAAFALARLPNIRMWLDGRWYLLRLRDVSREIGRACLSSLERDFPFVRPAKKWPLWTDVGAAHGFVDLNLGSRLARAIVDEVKPDELTKLVSPGVLTNVILRRAERDVGPEVKSLLRE